MGFASCGALDACLVRAQDGGPGIIYDVSHDALNLEGCRRHRSSVIIFRILRRRTKLIWPETQKTVYLRFNVDRDLDDGNSDVNIQGENLERVNTLKYLGATLAENRELDAEMTHRIQSGWKNWKRISRILCDRRISLRVKWKVYNTVVRPAMMYGAETWAVKKAHEKKLDVAEMMMCEWSHQDEQN